MQALWYHWAHDRKESTEGAKGPRPQRQAAAVPEGPTAADAACSSTPVVNPAHMSTDRRVRLNDDDIGLIVSALRSRAAMTKGLRRHRLERLAARLAEGGRGNPKFKLGDFEQTHEDELDADEIE